MTREARDDPVLGVVLARAAAGSVPGRRSDGCIVSLVVEGGGVRGVVSAGMCAVLEAAGLVSCFDRIYGCSAGALAGCFTAAGQAALWATSFEDTASRECIDPVRLLRRRPVFDLGFLFETAIARRRPLLEAGIARGPAFRAVAVSAEDLSLRILGDFVDTDELLAALRVSCTLPLLGGTPSSYRGEPMLDGALIEPIPYRTALAEGSSHVLVLRSRDACYRARSGQRVAELAISRAHPHLRALLGSAARYNRDAHELEQLTAVRSARPAVTQVAVAPESRLVGRMSTDPGRIAESLRAGAAAMASRLYGEPARLMWRPVAYLPHDGGGMGRLPVQPLVGMVADERA